MDYSKNKKICLLFVLFVCGGGGGVRRARVCARVCITSCVLEAQYWSRGEAEEDAGYKAHSIDSKLQKFHLTKTNPIYHGNSTVNCRLRGQGNAKNNKKIFLKFNEQRKQPFSMLFPS